MLVHCGLMIKKWAIISCKPKIQAKRNDPGLQFPVTTTPPIHLISNLSLGSWARWVNQKKTSYLGNLRLLKKQRAMNPAPSDVKKIIETTKHNTSSIPHLKSLIRYVLFGSFGPTENNQQPSWRRGPGRWCCLEKEEWYCWWFRNPKANHRLDGANTRTVNNGIN